MSLSIPFRLSLFAAVAGLVGALTAGCLDQRVELVDEGRLCVWADTPDPFGDGPQTFEAGRSATITVEIASCLSSSCSADYEAECTASVQGGAIAVTSAGGYTELRRSACTADCRSVHATCETGPLAAGTYALTHGDDALTVEVPSQTEATPCTEPRR